MKLNLLLAALLLASTSAFAQEYRIVTTIESIVPMGIGRSRMLDHKNPEDYKSLTTTRTDGKKSDQGDVKRDDIKIDNFDETKLLNFYSLVGINFGNIASNDAIIAAKMNEMIKLGWKVSHITSGVESDAGKDDGNGIFITRIFFYKES